MGPLIRFTLSNQVPMDRTSSDNTSILARWSEHFQSFFSAYRNVQDTAIHHIPQPPLTPELDDLPYLQEMIEAMAHLQCRKAAGVDGITSGIWMFGGPISSFKLHDLICYGMPGKFLQDFCDAVMITLYKNKGEKSDCSNYRGIALLFIAVLDSPARQAHTNRPV